MPTSALVQVCGGADTAPGVGARCPSADQRGPVLECLFARPAETDPIGARLVSAQVRRPFDL